MADFTFQLSQPTNQIQPHVMPVDQGSLGGIAALANNILVPLVQEYREKKDESLVEQMSVELNKEYDTLVEARRQGSITTSQMLSKLNVKARQLGADYPELAKQWRGRIREEYGDNLSNLAVASDISEFKSEDQVKQTLKEQAITNNLVVRNSRGEPDWDATIETVQKLNNATLQAEYLKKYATGSEVDKAADLTSLSYKVYQQTERAIYRDLASIQNDKSLSDADKMVKQEQVVNEYKMKFSSQWLNPQLSTVSIKREDATAIDNHFSKKFDDLAIDIKKGTDFQKKSNLADAVVQSGINQFTLNNPTIATFLRTFPEGGNDAIKAALLKSNMGGVSLSDVLEVNIRTGIESMDGVLPNENKDLPIHLDKESQRAKKEENLINISALLTDSTTFSNIKQEAKPTVVNTLRSLDKDYTSRPVLSDDQVHLHTKTMKTIIEAASESTNTSDKEQMLKDFTKDGKYTTLKQALSMPDTTAAAWEVLQGVKDTARAYLSSHKRTVLEEAIAKETQGYKVVNIDYDFATGKIVPVVNEQELTKAAKYLTSFNPTNKEGAVEGLKTYLRQSSIKNISKVLDPYNNALTAYSKAFLTGSAQPYSDAIIKYNIANKLGYTIKGMTSFSKVHEIPSEELGIISEEEVTTAPLDNAVE